MVDKITTPPTQNEVISKINELVDNKQDTLVSGTNIKTINNIPILGSGNIDIQGGGSITVDSALSTTSTNPVQNKVITSALDDKQDNLTSLNAGTDISITNTASINKTVNGNNSIVLQSAIENGLNSVTLSGACEQNGVPSPSTPVDIVCNNGTLVVENIFDKDATDAVVNMYPNVVPIGSTTSLNSGGSYDFKALLMPARPNTEYIFKRLTDCGSLYNRIRVVSLTSSAPPLTTSSGVMLVNVSDKTTPSVTFTTLNNTRGLFISVRDGAVVADDWERFVNNVSVVPTKPYVDGITETVEDSLTNTATAENLLSAGEFKDTQEILTGAITRNVGIKILDGTENWEFLRNGVFQLFNGIPDFKSQPDNNVGYSNYFSVIPLSTNIGISISNGQLGWNSTGVLTICNTTTQTVTDFKQWLSNLYVQSTPVIILYPLDTSTTETVTGQTLTTQVGNNTITINQASIDKLLISANYIANDGTLISFNNETGYATTTYVNTGLSSKQATLISGTNIKTINGTSLLGSGNIDIQGGGGSSYTAGTGIDITNNVISAKIATSVSSTSTNEQSVGAKLFYDTVGDIETALHTINSGGVQTATLTVRVYDEFRQFNSFTINEETYTDFSISGEVGEYKTKDINIPINTDLLWTASAKKSEDYIVTPSSGTLNISSDYVLELEVEMNVVIGPV